MDVRPQDKSRRSFLYRKLLQSGAHFVEQGSDATIAAHYGDARAEVPMVMELAIADLSPLPRTGFKGPGAADWLAEQGVELGEASNFAYPCGNGSLAARLSHGDILILGNLAGDDELWQSLESSWTHDGAKCWPMPRRDGFFWFLITGVQAPQMFAKVCAVDLRPKSFANYAIAQTSLARVNSVIIRDDIGVTPAYHVLADSASAEFLWDSLFDAMAEFDGKPIGVQVLRHLKSDA